MKKLCIVMLTSALAACSKPEAEKPAPQPATAEKPGVVRVDPALVAAGRIKVEASRVGEARDEVTAPGEVAAAEDGQAEVGTLVAGRVARIDAGVGDRVKKGQVLAVVESPEVGRVSADVLRARARVDAAQKRLDRQLALAKEDATSGAAVDEARAEQRTARADLTAALTALHSMGGADPGQGDSGRPVGGRIALRSPLDGVVLERLAVLGAPASPDRALFKIVAADRRMIIARWPETAGPAPSVADLARVAPRSGDPAQRCDATVQAVIDVVDDATRARPIRLAPRGPCPWLSQGAFVAVSFARRQQGSAPPLPVVPRDAVIEVRGVQAVFVEQEPPGTFSLRTVRLGPSTGVDATIESGVSAGEKVVTTGALLLKGELLRAELEGG